MKPKVSESIFSILLILISLGVYIYLFLYADRKIVFLYDHLGHTPFDAGTSGRYWMAGFILSGFLTIFYLIFKLFMKLILKSDNSNWIAITKISFIPLAFGIMIITMNFGEPQMTFLIAISSAASLIIGLMIGLSVVDDLISDLNSTLKYLITGLGLVPVLILLRVLELPGKGILSMNSSILISIFSIIGGLFWLLIANIFIGKNKILPINVIKGALAISYLGFPVLHYLVATPKGIPYITASSNFFADDMILRITTWIIVILLAFLGDKLSKKITLS